MTMGFEARKIVRSCRSGAIATIQRKDGTPYVSFCAYATDYGAQPIFLFSDLADHTQNLAQNGNVSLLCEQASHLTNPQAGPRVTLVGEIEKITDAQTCLLFLQQHASAKKYAAFGDFNFYRLNVEKAHFVGGFGRAIWFDSKDYMGDSAASLYFLAEQVKLLSDLKEDFPDFARICATKLLKLRGKNWQLLRVDSDGVDLKLASKVVRYPFDTEMKNVSQVMEFVAKICR
jgi:heme oxygenase (biliverdin-IX-beta and delta-forming)